MATSLAAQLKKLAVPETQSVLSGDLKQSSFLYDDKEAATYDKQHFYNIGVNGLQQLIEKNERFAEFENSLFSPSSQALQRYVQSADVNKQLDETLTNFLLRLSPYMQLREAHKAMEWLVHRYNVHLRNVDALMMCVLPYHDQEPFVMTLRLLKMNSNECKKWRWLEPIKKGDSFLPRQTLIAHCRAAKGFLGFMCDMLRKHIEANTDDSSGPSARHLQRVISFYTQTILGVMMAGPPTENILSTLIPAISEGLKSHDLPDYMVSSYMILSQLLLKTSLASSLLGSFLNVIAKNVQPNLLHSAITVLVIMFQKQNISKVSKKSFKYLSKQPSLTQILSTISKEAKAEPFLSPFMSVLTQRALKESSGSSVTSDSNADEDEDASPPSLISLLIDMLTVVPLEKKTIAVVIREVLYWFVNKHDDVDMEIDNQNLPQDGSFRVFRLLENRFSDTLDQVIKDLTSTDESEEMKSVVKNLLELSVASAQHDLTSDPMSCMAVCLHHRHGDVRKKAVERLLEDTSLMEDKENVQSAITMRLQDDDPAVVAAVLGEPMNLWKLFDDKSLLYKTLMKKLRAVGGKIGRDETKEQVLTALCCVPQDTAIEKEIVVIVLSFLVTLDESELDTSEQLLQSPVASWNKLLGQVKTKCLPLISQQKKKKGKNDKTLAEVFLALMDAVSSYLMTNNQQAQIFLEALYSSLHTTPRPGSAGFLLTSVYLALINRIKKPNVRTGLQKSLGILLKDMTLCKHLICSSQNTAFDVGQHGQNPEARTNLALSQLANKGNIPLRMLFFFITEMDIASVPDKLKDLKFWDLTGSNTIESDWLRTVTAIISLLFELSVKKDTDISSSAQSSFKNFIKKFEDTRTIVKFLCMLWMADSQQGVTSTYKARSMQFAQVFINSLSESEKLELATDPTPFLPCLLILLSSRHERVRQVSFTLLASVASGMSAENSNFIWFAGSLLKYREEVTKDNAFLAQVLKNILEGEESSLSPPSPKKRRRSGSKPPSHSVAMGYLLDIVCDEATTSNVKVGLLGVLHMLDTAESFLPLMSFFKRLIKQAVSHKSTSAPSESLTENEKEIVKLLLKHFTTSVAVCVEEKSDSLEALLGALTCTFTMTDSGETVQMLAVEQLRSKFMLALPAASQKSVFAQLLNEMCSSNSVEMGRRCRKVIKHMTIESSLIIDELKSVLARSSAGTIREAKRKKIQTTEEPAESELDSLPWRRIVMLLEMIQSKKKVLNAVLLLPVAFQVLARVLELENKGSGEYIKQLLLGTVNYICSRHQKKDKEDDLGDTVRGEHVNMELIVQCIRSSDNPHTHHQALLLLSSAAKIAPGLLLHNMMSVFTFMGANILRQDDAYSFDVIGRILENVIPALVMACEEKSKGKQSPKKKSQSKSPSSALGKQNPIRSEDMMTVVLRVFVDAIPHIPSHRKIMLFEKLVSVVGSETYLWRLILLFIESVTVRSSKPGGKEEENTGSGDEKVSGPLSIADLEFLTSLTEEFSSSQLFQCFAHALNYVLGLPQEKTSAQVKQISKDTLNLEEMSSEDMEIFSVPHHTSKQLRHFKFATVFALHQLVGSQHFVAKLSEVEASSFLPDYQSLMETVLQFIGQVTESHDRYREDSSGRFWRILLHKSHDLLDSLVNLLPDSMFMEVVSGLMSHSLLLVQRRAMELLNNKLQHYKESLTTSQVDMLLTMTIRLQSIVKQCLVKGAKVAVKDEELVNGQTALYSLKVLCRILGEKNQKPFMEVLCLCVKVLSQHQDNGMVSASTMLCIAEVVSAAKVHTIEHLGEFMPLVIAHLQSDVITHHEVLLLAAITALQKIIEAVPLFLSPYLLDIIIQVCILSSIVGSDSDSHKPVVITKIKHICTTLATVTPTRTFLPVLEKAFITLEDKMASCVECAMNMLKDHIVHMSREDLTTFSQDLLKFFFVCFDIRTTQTQISERDVDIIEGCVIEAFVSLVFKLSEAQFKPMLLQLYSWATDDETTRDRVLFFYRLCDSLAAKLKNLFTLFAGHIIKHSAQILDENNKSKSKCKYFGKGKKARRKSCSLLRHVVDCLQKTFAHDTEGFLNKERFDVVMQPLVDQLENQLGKDSESEERVINHVVPCIASLAAAAHDDSLWKDLNYQILLKTRDENPKVRIWALSAVDAFHKQIGEDYTQFVPETIPFMAELMEDESDEVEKHTQKVLAAMEVSVGENLQEYF